MIAVPAGASKRIDAVVPRAARPGPPTLRAISPSPTCGRAGSITPPGQFQYAVAPGVGRHAVHDAFSMPKQALTEYPPADAGSGQEEQQEEGGEEGAHASR